jgi:hypothetical protein
MNNTFKRPPSLQVQMAFTLQRCGLWCVGRNSEDNIKEARITVGVGASNAILGFSKSGVRLLHWFDEVKNKFLIAVFKIPSGLKI